MRRLEIWGTSGEWKGISLSRYDLGDVEDGEDDGMLNLLVANHPTLHYVLLSGMSGDIVSKYNVSLTI